MAKRQLQYFLTYFCKDKGNRSLHVGVGRLIVFSNVSRLVYQLLKLVGVEIQICFCGYNTLR